MRMCLSIKTVFARYHRRGPGATEKQSAVEHCREHEPRSIFKTVFVARVRFHAGRLSLR